MQTELTQKVEEAIGKMADQTKASGGDPLKAMQFSQAALNLSHVNSHFHSISMNSRELNSAKKTPNVKPAGAA
jgi:uncharacterized membrane protein